MGQKIVLITGAGASVPYNYPIGSDLVNIIRDQLDNKSSRLYSFLTGHNRSEEMSRIKYGLPAFSEQTVEDFRRKFIMAGSYSIDEFLSSNFDKYGRIGKFCVAHILREREVFGNLHPSGKDADRQSQDWLRLLLNNYFGTNLNSDLFRDITYITFNYDRLFEQKLHDYMIGLHGSLTPDQWNVIRSMGIHHVYGQIGPASWNLLDKDEPWNDFGFIGKKDYWQFQVQASAKNIRVFTEENQREAPLSEELCERVYNAEKIFFLGFGFNETNIERLGVEWQKVRGKVYGTIYFANNSDEIIQLCQKYNIDTSLFENVSCLDLLSKYWKEEVVLKAPYDKRKRMSRGVHTGGKTFVQKFKDGEVDPEY